MNKAQAPSSAVLDSQHFLKGHEVLLVGMDRERVDSLSAQIAQAGGNLVLAATEQELEGILERAHPDLVVAADMVPDVDAIRVLRAFGSEKDRACSIALVQEVDPHRVAELRDAGFFACLCLSSGEDMSPLILWQLKHVIAAEKLVEENGDLKKRVKRQSRSFSAIVRKGSDRLFAAYSELKRMDKLKLDLITLISHQIRTPL